MELNENDFQSTAGDQDLWSHCSRSPKESCKPIKQLCEIDRTYLNPSHQQQGSASQTPVETDKWPVSFGR